MLVTDLPPAKYLSDQVLLSLQTAGSGGLGVLICTKPTQKTSAEAAGFCWSVAAIAETTGGRLGTQRHKIAIFHSPAEIATSWFGVVTIKCLGSYDSLQSCSVGLGRLRTCNNYF